MRWRGLACASPPWQADCSATVRCVAVTSWPWQPIARPPCAARLPRCPGIPIAQLPCAARPHRLPVSRRPRRLPSTSGVPRVSPEADPVFSGERFLLPMPLAAQGLSARTSRFFSRPQDICCLSPVHSRFPPRRAQLRPQGRGITGRWSAGAGLPPCPDRHSRRPSRTAAIGRSSRRADRGSSSEVASSSAHLCAGGQRAQSESRASAGRLRCISPPTAHPHD